MNKKRTLIFVAILLTLVYSACGGTQVESPPQTGASASSPSPKTQAIAPPQEGPHWSYEVAEGRLSGAV